MELMLHQQETIDHCLSQRGALVACGVGTGKVATTISCMKLTKKQLKSFQSKIEIQADGCWIWKGCIKSGSKGGYGIVSLNRKTLMAHRVAYEHFVRSIPKGLVIDHLCRVRACVNPGHLEAVTQKENIRRGDTGLYNKIKTYCINGHPYSVENTRIYSSGERECKTCRIATKRRYRQRRRDLGLPYA